MMSNKQKNRYEKVTSDELARGIRLCKKNIENYLHSLKILLSGKSVIHACLLFIFALDETGKLLRLQEYAGEDSNLIEIDKKYLFYGSGVHEKRISASQQELQKISSGFTDRIRRGAIVNFNMSKESCNLDIGNTSITIPYGTTGTFMQGNEEGLIIDANLRESLLYVNLTEGKFSSPFDLFDITGKWKNLSVRSLAEKDLLDSVAALEKLLD